jgi:hypothetical protein
MKDTPQKDLIKQEFAGVQLQQIISKARFILVVVLH